MKKKLYEVEDETFKEAGKVGLWTKADSTTLFDDFSYGADPKIVSADKLEKESRKKAAKSEDDDDDDKK